MYVALASGPVLYSPRPGALALLLMRELRGADNVLAVKADDDSPALLSIDGDGGLSVCRSDPGGVGVTYWGRLKGISVEESFEVRLERTRLRTWTLRHPKFPRGGTLSISTDGFSEDEQREVGALLKRLVDYDAFATS